MNRQEICYMILSFVLISSFIVIFFFTYVSKIEKEVIKIHIEDMTKNLFQETDLYLNSQQKDIIKKVIQLNRPEVTESVLRDDKRVEDYNNELFKKSIKLFSLLFVIGIILIGIIYITRKKDDNINLFIVIRNSLIILACVAVLEFAFVTIISKNYILVDSTLFKSLFFKKLSDYSKS